MLDIKRLQTCNLLHDVEDRVNALSVEPLLVYPDPPPPVLSQGLDLAGYPWTGVGSESDVERLEPAEFRLLSLMATGLLRLRLMRHGRSSPDPASSAE